MATAIGIRFALTFDCTKLEIYVPKHHFAVCIQK